VNATTAAPFVDSAEQLAIYDWFRGTGALSKKHLVVNALAGTGKTTTILRAIEYAPEQRILLAAFNKRIQEELARRITNANAEAKTLHGVGFACVRRFWEGIKVASGNGREVALAESVCGGQAPDAIKRLVGRLCTKGREIAPHATTAGELADLIEEFDLAPDEEWAESGFDAAYVEARALDAMKLAAEQKPAAGIDFADMLYLPVRNKWLVKTYDLGVVDEAQDMTLTQLELFLGVVKGRVVVVGDPNQAIYAFRGADCESLGRLKAELDADELSLTTTYRCPKLVVDYARRFVPAYKAADTAPDGTIASLASIDALVQAAENRDHKGNPHDFILSRTNAPLAGVAMALIRSQKRVRIQGKDIGAGLISLVRKLSKGKAQHSIPALFERLAAWEKREIVRLTKLNREDLFDGVRDKAETLRVVAEGAACPRELEARLSALFADEGNGGTIVCSSVHKAKGLEAQRVFILRPTLNRKPPKDKPFTPKQAQEERNIEYVAVTRAQQTLVWVEAK
jgi:superfamily I DNA/RNA helicase